MALRGRRPAPALDRCRDGGVTGRTIGEAVVGEDGRPRCPWAGESPSPLARYHDEVWGQPTKRSSALFEALTLGVFEVGLSWRVIFSKRDAFRRAFHGFNVQKVSALRDKDVDRLVQDPSIITIARLDP